MVSFIIATESVTTKVTGNTHPKVEGIGKYFSLNSKGMFLPPSKRICCFFPAFVFISFRSATDKRAAVRCGARYGRLVQLGLRKGQEVTFDFKARGARAAKGASQDDLVVIYLMF